MIIKTLTVLAVTRTRKLVSRMEQLKMLLNDQSLLNFVYSKIFFKCAFISNSLKCCCIITQQRVVSNVFIIANHCPFQMLLQSLIKGSSKGTTRGFCNYKKQVIIPFQGNHKPLSEILVSFLFSEHNFWLYPCFSEPQPFPNPIIPHICHFFYTSKIFGK